MNIDKIECIYNEFRANGWDVPQFDMLNFYGWSCHGDNHVRKGNRIRFVEDALLEEYGIDNHEFFELIGANKHSGDVLTTFERWLGKE